MALDNSEVVAYYAIYDDGDGSASLQLYGSETELKAALIEAEDDGSYDLSEGGGQITQKQLDDLKR
jgi:hypothetical protein